MQRVTVYTKPRCPLCEEAMEEVEQARRQFEFELREVNILTDWAVYERYKHAIPVVVIGGREVFRYRLTAQALLQRLTEQGGDLA